MNPKVGIIIIAALLLLVGIMAYGWGKSNAEGDRYREGERQAKAELSRLQETRDSADKVIEGLQQAIADRQPEQEQGLRALTNEEQRRRDERKTLDTAGADYKKRIVLWTNPH